MPIVLGLAGCEPVSLTLFGVGAATGVSHTLGGMVYKTFTAPLGRVKKATLAALARMDIRVTGGRKTEHGEIITAKSADREIEIELEAISGNTTRMEVVANKNGGVVKDAATATEIILQTEKVLGPI